MKNNEIQKQLAKLRRDKRILWLGILFFVLVVLWILLSIFTTSRTSSVSQELRDLAKPFVPRLESRVFDEILRKRAFDQGELQDFPIYVFDKQVGEDGLEKVNIINSPEELEAEEGFEIDLAENQEASGATESTENSAATESSEAVLTDDLAV